MTEKYVVSLIMEGHNTAPTEIGVLREERLYHPEEWKRQERHVRKKNRESKLANYWKEAAAFHK